jgi:hypothetical protein
MSTIVQCPIPLIGYYEDASISCLALASRRPLDGMFARYRDLFRELDQQHRLRELDPLLARDIGVAVGCDWRADGSPVDVIPFLVPRLAFQTRVAPQVRSELAMRPVGTGGANNHHS